MIAVIVERAEIARHSQTWRSRSYEPRVAEPRADTQNTWSYRCRELSKDGASFGMTIEEQQIEPGVASEVCTDSTESDEGSKTC